MSLGNSKEASVAQVEGEVGGGVREAPGVCRAGHTWPVPSLPRPTPGGHVPPPAILPSSDTAAGDTAESGVCPAPCRDHSEPQAASWPFSVLPCLPGQDSPVTHSSPCTPG